MEALILVVAGLLTIAAATTLGPRVRIAPPLLLVVVGIGVSLLPFVPEVELEPEWILAGVLPPLLYSAAVSMPAMDFRREFTAIGGLSVVLVVLSALLLGLFFAAVIPGLDLAWGIALGAIVSPTDAVATSIVKRLGVSPRIVAVLEGESLLNDATALVVLRAAISGAAASVSLPGVLGDFLFAVVAAVAIGGFAGWLNLRVRARVADATVNTVISFTVPFIASIPAEELGASGLVAAVVAGLVTGHGAPRLLSPQHRLSDAQNWRTVELILESGVFLVMGLELAGILDDVHGESTGIGTAAAIAAAALLLTVLVRAAYVAPLMLGLRARAGRGAQMKPRIADMQEQLAAPGAAERPLEGFGRPGRTVPGARIERFRTRARRALADIDYFLAAPLDWRDGTIIVWAGMRGAVTLAAAQTLPEDAPHRSLLILIAFLVGAGSLLLQGGTLARVVALVKPTATDFSPADLAEHARLLALLRETEERVTAAHVATAPDDPDDERRANDDAKRLTLAVIAAQRDELLDARDDGTFSAGMLRSALAALDADQISLELKGAPVDGD